MARLRASWRTSLPVVQQPRYPQSESIARSPYQNHGRVLLAHLVEGRPDPGVVVVVDPAREGDARTGREKDLGLGPALGGEESAAVDHRRGERAVVAHRPGPGPSGGAGVGRVVLGGVVAQE